MKAPVGRSLASTATALVGLAALVATPAWLVGRVPPGPSAESPALELGSGRDPDVTLPGLSLDRGEARSKPVTAPPAAPGASDALGAVPAAAGAPALAGAPEAASAPGLAPVAQALTAPGSAPAGSPGIADLVAPAAPAGPAAATGGPSEAARLFSEVLRRLAEARAGGQLPGWSPRPGAGDHPGGNAGGRAGGDAGGRADGRADGDTGGRNRDNDFGASNGTGGDHGPGWRVQGGTRQPQPRWPTPQTLSRLFGNNMPGT